MKTVEILRAIYNDKAVLNKLRKSIEEYAINIKSMNQLKEDSKDIELYIKETYKISPTIFKKIVKSSMEQDNNIDDLIDEIQLIKDIGEIE